MIVVEVKACMMILLLKQFFADLYTKAFPFIGEVLLPAMLIITAAVLTVRTHFFQFCSIGDMFKTTVGSLISRKKRNKDEVFKQTKEKTNERSSQQGTVSPFSALCTALSATIGTGNIAGVAYAMVMGGAGAVFWMWAATFVGMILKFAEGVLAVKYRVSEQDGVKGGAMYYIEKCTHRFGFKKSAKAFARIFAVATVFASFGIGNMSQASAISKSMESAFGLSDASCVCLGIALSVAAAAVVIGGAKRIAGANERLVPFMAAFYIAGCLVILAVRAEYIGDALFSIFSSAFGADAATGGIGGYAVAKSASWGLRRGLFSNEAGLGSSATVHAMSQENNPVKQGFWGMFEVFFDTGVICTLTSLVILTTTGIPHIGNGANGANIVGDEAKLGLAVNAFSFVFGNYGGAFVALSVALFAFSSILGWCFYGEKACEYLFGKKITFLYKAVFSASIIPGMMLGADLVMNVSDLFNIFMAVPNLSAVLLMSGEISQCVKVYLKSTGKGRGKNKENNNEKSNEKNKGKYCLSANGSNTQI